MTYILLSMYHTLDMKAMPIPILQIAKVFTLSPRDWKVGAKKFNFDRNQLQPYTYIYIDQFLISLQK